jgi:ubiquinone/menaquinone biosynthesis C-methylase UbiE
MKKKEWTGERLETFIHSQVTAEHLHRYALAMQYVQGKTVLDIACGEGYGSNLLSENAAFVTGVDIDKATIEAAKGKYRKNNVSFLEGSVEAIPMQDHSVDVVVSFETLEHTSHHEAFLDGIKRVLKPGGLLIISTPDKKWYTDKPGQVNPFHTKELYRDEFELLLKRNFTHVNIVLQKFFCGSVLFDAVNPETDIFRGNFESIATTKDPEALYMISLASDMPLPAINRSFFNADDILHAAVVQKEAEIKDSFNYRLGSFLLAPAKWIKKRFK